jgi:hypothetical protein
LLPPSVEEVPCLGTLAVRDASGEDVGMMRLLGVVMLALAACGHAVPFHRDPSGGVLRLGGNRSKAMEDARRQMASHCGAGGFAVTQEGEEQVNAKGDTEYHVYYQCSTAAAEGANLRSPTFSVSAERKIRSL